MTENQQGGSYSDLLHHFRPSRAGPASFLLLIQLYLTEFCACLSWDLFIFEPSVLFSFCLLSASQVPAPLIPIYPEMASTDSTASWNPAHRPNAEDDVDSAADGQTPLPDHEPAQQPLSEPSVDVVPIDDLTSQQVNSWVSQDTGEDNWLEESHPVADGSAAKAQAPEVVEAARDNSLAEPVANATSSPGDANPPKEPDWTGADAEEGDAWFLDQKENGNPFEFMPPSNRTNSFPPVPPLDAPKSSHVRSLSRTQAQDVMTTPEGADATTFETGEGAQEDDTAATRYEEGLPLLSHDSPHHDTQKETSAGSRVADAFADEEDEFFNNISESAGREAESAFLPGSLDRKSTMQAMGVGDSLAAAQAPSLSDTPEHDEQAAAAKVGVQETPTAPGASDSNPEASKADDEAALAAKWSEAFADDDLDVDEELLGDSVTESKEMDPADFFGSDDEGFLDDVDEQPSSTVAPSAVPAPESAAAASPSSAQGRYTPQPQTSTAPAHAPTAPTSVHQPPPVTQPNVPASFGTPYGAPQQRPEPPKAQSFADKAKGGYSSPYDLPMEVVKPKKRASLQHLPKSTVLNGPPAPGPPPRSASMFHQAPPSSAGASPAEQGSGSAPPMNQKPPAQPPKAKEAFFEDLPITTRPRPASRPSRTSSPALGPTPNARPTGPPPMRGPSPGASPTAAYHPPLQPPAAGPPPGLAPSPEMTRSGSGGVSALVQPERVNPYAPAPAPGPAQSQASPAASATANRYSPAPASQGHLNGSAPPPASNKYSPAPPGSRQSSSSYVPAPTGSPASILPHQPRTSSPLAHFETTAQRSSSQPMVMNGETHDDRRGSLPHEPKLNRVPSLPPPREVEEEYEQTPKTSHSAGSQPPTTAELRYNPASQSSLRQTPPPLTHVPGQAMLSPPKRSPPKSSPYTSRSSQPAVSQQKEFAPPPRSYSQSPSSMQRMANESYAPASDAVRRPSSAHDPASPTTTQSPVNPYMAPTRSRAPSLTLNMVPPTDGRENDPLQRWKGAPVVSWGVGGTVLTSFPKSVPRYGVNQTAPMIVRTPGELKINNVKELVPLGDRLAKFPGPLKGKSKKKETMAWLNAGIESLASSTPDLTYVQNPSLEDKRATERLLLWKLLRIFVENDGVLEGSPAIQKAVRDVLVPGLDEQSVAETAPVNVSSLHQLGGSGIQGDAVDPAGIELIRKHLLIGDREKAAWAAVDKRLWGHAMLIANTVSLDLYKQVAQEFVRKEVNYPGYSNESVAALYKVLSGNHEECVDELVPVHARAGLQLMSTSTTGSPSKDALDGLDKWRETLCLILSNRTLNDAGAFIALGELLSNYGRAEAAHICFIFGRQASVFGGLDDPRSNFVLVGADHKSEGDQLFKDTEALLLSEVYEYGMCLAGGVTATVPHLAAYKLQLATTLAEYGHQSRALDYCAAISSAFNAQTKRSPYYSPALEHAVNDLVARLKQAPKEESSSWIPKPSMNKVSDSMWSTFNKFVSGDDNDASADGVHGDGPTESGPFAGVPSGSPTISRTPSTANLDIYGARTVGYPGKAPAATPAATPAYPAAPAQPVSRSASRYAPAPQQAAAPHNPYEAASSPYTPRSSSEIARNPNPYEPSRPSTGYQQQYTPSSPSQTVSQSTQSNATAGYGATSQQPHPAVPQAPSYQPQAPVTPPGSGYTPFGAEGSLSPHKPSDQPEAPSAPGDGQSSQGYHAPSYGFEPPSMTPEQEAPADTAGDEEDQGVSSGGYEPPSYGYEPPSYEPDPEPTGEDGEPPKPKKGMMDDDEDDIPALRPQQKSKAEKDRENEEMIRRVAEQEGEVTILNLWFRKTRPLTLTLCSEASSGKVDQEGLEPYWLDPWTRRRQER